MADQTQYQQYPNSYYDPYGIMNALNQQRGVYPQQVQPVQQPTEQPKKPDYIYRPVGGLEEARAAQIEWDGTLYLFHDNKTGHIYTKQFRDGGISFKGFAEFEIPEPKQVEYATAESVAALAMMVENLTKEISAQNQKSTAKTGKDDK